MNFNFTVPEANTTIPLAPPKPSNDALATPPGKKNGTASSDSKSPLPKNNGTASSDPKSAQGSVVPEDDKGPKKDEFIPKKDEMIPKKDEKAPKKDEKAPTKPKKKVPLSEMVPPQFMVPGCPDCDTDSLYTGGVIGKH
ncbi:hypothetical protein AAMO2058_000746000 [Amorphochlora amoebiformis]